MFTKGLILEKICGFNSVLHSPAAKEVLEPFSDIIEKVALGKTPSISPNIPEIESDISTIYNAFLSSALGTSPETTVKRESVGQQKLNMFKSLLAKFSENVSAAADGMGYSDLSTAVRAGGLAKASLPLWSQYTNFRSTNRENNISIAKKMVIFVLKNYNYRWANYNYSQIEMLFMGSCGQLTREQMFDINMKYEQDKDVLGLVDDESSTFPAKDTSAHVTLDKHLHPDYLQMLLAFFAMLQEKVGLPSGFSA